MARAGFCTECGDNVVLKEDGTCPEGHGPECIHDQYDVSEDGADVADESTTADVEAPSEEAAGTSDFWSEEQPPEVTVPPVPPVAAANADAPESTPVTGLGESQPRRTGMIVFAASVLVVAVAVLAFVFVFMPKLNGGGSSSTTTSSDQQKAKVEASLSFLHALFADDTNAIKPLLIDEAQSALTADEWAAIASAFPTAPVTFSDKKWASETTAVVLVSVSDGAGGESTATIAAGATNETSNTVNIVLSTADSSEVAQLHLQKAKDGWRIMSIADATGGVTYYDGEFVKNLLAQATSSSSETTSGN